MESVGAANRGIAVSRAYQTEDGRPDSPVLGPRSSVSELVTVKVSITLENDAYYLVLEDYIPAGAEILDLNLKTNQQGAADFNVRSPFAEGWGWWYFNDPLIFDDHIAWSADFAPAGTYELTYTLVLNQSGEYQVIPAQAWEFYFPEVRGNSAGEVFRIEE